MLILEDVFDAAMTIGCWEGDDREIALLQDVAVLLWQKLTTAQRVEVMRDDLVREIFEGAGGEAQRDYEEVFGVFIPPLPKEEVVT